MRLILALSLFLGSKRRVSDTWGHPPLQCPFERRLFASTAVRRLPELWAGSRNDEARGRLVEKWVWQQP